MTEEEKETFSLDKTTGGYLNYMTMQEMEDWDVVEYWDLTAA